MPVTTTAPEKECQSCHGKGYCRLSIGGTGYEISEPCEHCEDGIAFALLKAKMFTVATFQTRVSSDAT